MVSKIIDAILEKFDGFLNLITALHDRGVFLYGAMVLIVILIIGGIFGAIYLIMVRPSESSPEIPKEKQQITDNAVSYCSQKGFNSWKWVNESVYQFKCINITKEKINLSDYELV